MVRFGLKSWSQKQTYFFLGSRIFSMVNHSSRLWFGTKNCVDYGAVLFFSSSPRCFPGITKTITISLSLRDVIKEWPLPPTQRILAYLNNTSSPPDKISCPSFQQRCWVIIRVISVSGMTSIVTSVVSTSVIASWSRAPIFFLQNPLGVTANSSAWSLGWRGWWKGCNLCLRFRPVNSIMLFKLVPIIVGPLLCLSQHNKVRQD